MSKEKKINIFCKLGFHTNKITRIDLKDKDIPGETKDVYYFRRTKTTYLKCKKCGEKSKQTEIHLMTRRYY